MLTRSDGARSGLRTGPPYWAEAESRYQEARISSPAASRAFSDRRRARRRRSSIALDAPAPPASALSASARRADQASSRVLWASSISSASRNPWPGRGLTLAGASNQRRRNSSVSGLAASSRARPGRPPEMRAVMAARPASNPRSTRAEASSSSETRPNRTMRQRLGTVEGRSPSASATRMNTVPAGGSSSVLSSALAAASVIVEASSKMNTLRPPSTGRRLALATARRTWSTPRAALPSGPMTTASGWVRRITRARASAVRPTRAAANRRAAAALPTLEGPANR